MTLLSTSISCFLAKSSKLVAADSTGKPKKSSSVMRTPLRDHPLMRRGDISNWPPLWTQGTKGGGTAILRGEVGVLRYVHSTDQTSKKCFLVIEHNGQHYIGTLVFDDSGFCSQVCALLQQHLGQSIKEIGDLEVSFTPNRALRWTY